jgi:hypothetical protein
MRFISFTILPTLLFIFSFDKAKAQSEAGVSSSSLQVTRIYFQNEIKEDAHLYTGEAYSRYDPGVKGDPFYLFNQMQNGDLFYDDVLYKDVPLLFDIVRQKVIINRYHDNTRIQLLNEKIKYFTLGGHRFENFSLASGKDGSISKDIYEVVFSGKAAILANRLKNIKHGLKADDPYTFTEEDVLYVRNGSNLFQINNRKAVLPAFNDKKELIKTFIRKKHLKFKKNIEKDLIMIAAYYDKLKN